jgi:hypothetical protein
MFGDRTDGADGVDGGCLGPSAFGLLDRLERALRPHGILGGKGQVGLQKSPA